MVIHSFVASNTLPPFPPPKLAICQDRPIPLGGPILADRKFRGRERGEGIKGGGGEGGGSIFAIYQDNPKMKKNDSIPPFFRG